VDKCQSSGVHFSYNNERKNMYQEHNPVQPVQVQEFEVPVFMEQLNSKIASLEEQVKIATERASQHFNFYKNLQENIRAFFEEHQVDDSFRFNLDEANSFLAENSIETFKRLYRVRFEITGEIEVEAENEEEAQELVNELEVTHWSFDVTSWESEATGAWLA